MNEPVNSYQLLTWDDLTPREQRFVDEFIVTNQATEAYRRTASKPITEASAHQMGWRMLRKVNDVIAERRQLYDAEYTISRRRILEVFEREMDDRDENSAAERVSAAREAGKMCGHYPEPKSAATGGIAIQINLQASRAEVL